MVEADKPFASGPKTASETDRKRHFLKPDEVIALADAKVIVSNQWGVGNIDRFIQVAETLDSRIDRQLDLQRRLSYARKLMGR